MKKVIKFVLCLILIFALGISLTSCVDFDTRESNTYLGEETDAIEAEYTFKVISIRESNQYSLDGITYDSENDDGLFIILVIDVYRKTITEAADPLEITSSWFKLKKGVGTTTDIEANKHYDASDFCFETFTLNQGEYKQIEVIFDIEENFLNIDRALVLEIDKPWSTENAKEIVLTKRPNT